MKLRQWRGIWATMIALIVLGAAASTASAQGLAPEQAAEIDAIIEIEIETDRVPGMNVAVYGPGGSYSRSYGVSNLGTGAVMDSAVNVRIASISKTFTAVAVLRMIDKGDLRLGDKVSQFVDGVPNGDEITIRQLLGMSGGIYDFTRDEQFNAEFSSNPLYPGWRPEDVLTILARHDPDFPPGDSVNYSDSNYVLLGLVIEDVTGKPVRATINRLTRKAGLAHTTFPELATLRTPFATGYYAGDDGDGPLQDYTLVNPAVPWTAGNMTSTIGDLKRWARLLGTGKLLSERLYRAQTKTRPIANPGGPVISYGLGMFKLGDWIGHNGAIYGFNTAMFYLPSQKATILVSGNKSTNFSSEALIPFIEIARKLYPNSIPNNP